MFRRTHYRTRGSRRGAATAELAILLPFLAFLFVVAIDFCRVFYVSLTLVNCARNGALYLADPLTASESPYADYTAAALADAGNLSPAPTVTSASGTDVNGDPYVEVTVAFTFQTFTNYPGVPSTLNLTRTVHMCTFPNTPN
jgi:Flp pilus assembly protein TadG